MRNLFVAVILSLSICPLLIAEMRYSGQLLQIQAGQTPVAVEDFTCTVYPIANDGHLSLVNEIRSPLPWIEQVVLVPKSTPWLSSHGPAIAYRHLDRNYLLPLGVTKLEVPGDASVDSQWLSDDGVEFRITGELVEDGHDCWKIETEIGIARRHRIHVRKSDAIVQSAVQTHFMGKGDRFEIRLQMAPDDTQGRHDVSQFAECWQELNSKLDRNTADRLRPLTPEQTALASTFRERVLAATEEPALRSFAKAVVAEIDSQQHRESKLADLSREFTGQPLPKFTLLTFERHEIPSSSFLGKTIVLHFWDYAQPVTEQPYGQVAYLEFLNQRWQGKNIVVYGIAVNPRLDDPQTRSVGLRDIQRIKQFMRLNYEIVQDAGAALNSLGNPTRIGADLPLWIVIAPDGRIAHYKTGLYDVDPQIGLKELSDAVERVSQ